MKNRILSLLLSIVTVFTMLPAFALPAGASAPNSSAPAPDGSNMPQPDSSNEPSIEIAMYSSQVRDESTKMTNQNFYDLKNNYYKLENGTVWVMCEEGFTDAQKSKITAEVEEWGVTHDPIVPAWVLRPGTADRYDMKVALPKPKQINMTYSLIVKNGGVQIGSFGINTGLTNHVATGLYVGDYVVGFSTKNTKTNVVTVYEGSTRRLGVDGVSDSYQLFQDIDITVAEIKRDEAGGKYYEPVTNRSAKLAVSKVWIKQYYGPEAFSLSSKERKMEHTPSLNNDWELYYKGGEKSVIELCATVSVTVKGQTVTGDIGVVCFCQGYEETTYDCTQEGIDTVEKLNAFLQDLAEKLDIDSTTIIPDPMAVTGRVIYVQLADADYTGTVVIPQKLQESTYASVVLRGSGRTRLIGHLQSIANVNVTVDGVCFIAPDKDGNEENIAISGSAGVTRCVFYGYDVAVDCTPDGGLIRPGSSVFINNGVAIRIAAGFASSKNPWVGNTFINNETAVRILSLNSAFSPYYFRITNSNFINNGTDFDVHTEGTLYQYRNYFAEFCARGNGHIPLPGLPAADKHNGCDDLSLSAMLAATTEESVGNLLKRRPAQVDTNGTGARVITNPHWKFPVKGWWSGDPLESIISGRSNSSAGMRTRMRLAAAAEYENVLLADWKTETQIINTNADELIIDSSAFDEEGTKEIRIVDTDESTVGTWRFAENTNAAPMFRLLRSVAPSADFNAKLIVNYADEAGERFTVTVAESSIFSAKKPQLILPYGFDGAIVTAPDGSTQTAAAFMGQIAFCVPMSGTYTVSRLPGCSVTFDPANGEQAITETVLRGQTVAQPTQPTREGFLFLGWTADGVSAVEFPYVVLENVTFTAMWEKDETAENFWYWLLMLYAQEYDITAAATEGGTIRSAGTTKVKYGKDQTYTVLPDEGYEIADVLVDGKSVGAVREYTFASVKEDHVITAVFRPINPYTDVAETDACYEAVLYLYQNGIMNGTDAELGLFSPDAELSRAMLVTILWRMNGCPVVNYIMPFADVPAETWYTEAVRWAAGTKLVHGYSDTAFGPEDTLTREQLCAILYRYVQSKGEGFTGTWMYRIPHSDLAEVSDWSFEAMAWMNMKNIYTGENNAFLPKAYAPRSLVARMVYAIAEDR